MASYSKSQYKQPISQAKNLWCRGAYFDYMTEKLGFNPFVSDKQPFKKCIYSKDRCRGGHSVDQIKLFPVIKKYLETDYSKVNWIELYELVLGVMKRDVPKVLVKEYQDLAKNYETMDFIKLTQVWRQVAIFHRKLKKEENTSPYTLQNMPQFNLDDTDKDEFLWTFVKFTKHCETQQLFNTIIVERKTMSIWEVCLATGINCRAGAHETNELLCIPDFLNGVCDCMPKEKFESVKKDISDNIEKLETEIKAIYLEEESGKDEWVQVKAKKKNNFENVLLAGIKLKIQQYQKQYDDLIKSRLIHYTENGLIPFNIQFKEYQKKNVKIGWDRDIAQVPSKPVIKITKLKKN